MVGSEQEHRLVILYGVGGLSDVGRHAIVAALERKDVGHITVLTKHPNLLLEETKWNCACLEPHVLSDSDKERITIVPIESWTEPKDDFVTYFQNITAVISALGNRQPFFGHNDAAEGNDAVIHALQQVGKDMKHRVVIMTSVGIEEDKPPLEFFTMGRYALSLMFMTCSKRNFQDLTIMERAYKSTSVNDIDYLLVRPVGLGEDQVPVNKWLIQKQKNVDKLGFDMAKLDCARYMVEEAITPTRHREAVVIGSEP